MRLQIIQVSGIILFCGNDYIIFTYFYTAITINPTQMAEDMKRNNGFIPGIKPGKKTAEYIDDIMSRITLPGSFFLALVAIMPAFAGIFGVQAGFAQFFRRYIFVNSCRCCS